MPLIRCPWCGEDRPEIECAYTGEAHIARPADPAAVSMAACFVNAPRDTVTDRILATYRPGAPRPDLETLPETRKAAGA